MCSTLLRLAVCRWIADSADSAALDFYFFSTYMVFFSSRVCVEPRCVSGVLLLFFLCTLDLLSIFLSNVPGTGPNVRISLSMQNTLDTAAVCRTDGAAAAAACCFHFFIEFTRTLELYGVSAAVTICVYAVQGSGAAAYRRTHPPSLTVAQQGRD